MKLKGTVTQIEEGVVYQGTQKQKPILRVLVVGEGGREAMVEVPTEQGASYYHGRPCVVTIEPR